MAEIKRKLKPFIVPNYVIEEVGPRPRESGFVEAPKHALSELDLQTLEDLCAEFRANVLMKAGHEDVLRR